MKRFNTFMTENTLIKLPGKWLADAFGDGECYLEYDKPDRDIMNKLAYNWLVSDGAFGHHETDPKQWVRQNGFSFEGHPDNVEGPECIEESRDGIAIPNITRNWKKAQKELKRLGIDPKKDIDWDIETKILNPTKKADWA